jgi:hypothetical protein
LQSEYKIGLPVALRAFAITSYLLYISLTSTKPLLEKGDPHLAELICWFPACPILKQLSYFK